MFLLQVKCRRLFCQKETILIKGVCTYMSNRIVGYLYRLTLRLIPDRKENIEVNHFLDDKRNKVMDELSPWSKKWKIDTLYMKHNTRDSTSTFVEELLIAVTYHEETINPATLFDSIKSNLLKSRFSLFVGDTKFNFRQTVADYRVISFYPKIGDYINILSVAGIKTIQNQTVLDKIYKDSIYVRIPNGFPKLENKPKIQITQTHFCDMVQLDKDEYVLYAKSVVYYKLLNTYLFDGQFDMTTDEFGETVVKICLSDFGFHETNIANANLFCFIDLVIVVCFGFVVKYRAQFNRM